MITLFIGLFAGGTFQQTKEAMLQGEVDDLTYKLRVEMQEVDYWKTKWEDHDSTLHRISRHKDCTFDLRTIIGDLVINN